MSSVFRVCGQWYEQLAKHYSIYHLYFYSANVTPPVSCILVCTFKCIGNQGSDRRGRLNNIILIIIIVSTVGAGQADRGFIYSSIYGGCVGCVCLWPSEADRLQYEAVCGYVWLVAAMCMASMEILW